LDFATIGQSDGYIQSLTTTEDGKVVAMSDSGGNIKFWLIEDAPIPHEWKDALPNGTSTLALSPNGDRIFAGCDQSLRMWSTESRELVHTFATNTPRIHSVDWSSDGKLLAAAGAGNKIELWNAENFSKLGEIELAAEFITSIEISPNGQQLVAGTWSASVPTKPGEVILCDIEGQYVLKTLHGHRMNVHDVTFTPDGSKILSASDDGSVRIWDASQD
jgi:WD40 repeat protein